MGSINLQRRSTSKLDIHHCHDPQLAARIGALAMLTKLIAKVAYRVKHLPRSKHLEKMSQDSSLELHNGAYFVVHTLPIPTAS